MSELAFLIDNHPRVKQLIEALKFARSVIKCGESWTDTCEREIGGAIEASPGQPPRSPDPNESYNKLARSTPREARSPFSPRSPEEQAAAIRRKVGCKGNMMSEGAGLYAGDLSTPPSSLEGKKPRMPTNKEMDAFRRGKEAFRRETPQDCNPYDEKDDLRDFWSAGWLSAKYPSPPPRSPEDCEIEHSSDGLLNLLGEKIRQCEQLEKDNARLEQQLREIAKLIPEYHDPPTDDSGYRPS